MHLPINTLLHSGTYRIIRFISSGGFGCTYEAEHVMLEKRVAIKEFFVKDFCNRDETTCHVTIGTISKKGLVEKLRRKFIDEAKALCRLQHPGIVSVSDVFEENGTAYYVMDYVDGKSLSDIVKEQGPLSEERAVRYISQVATALQYVHDNNRLHLDIKPGNIMIDGEDNPVLIDFGASKQYDEEDGENTSTLLGKTPGYAPLEQMSNSVVKFLPATDIYALGATLYKMLTGITPLEANLRISEELEPLPAKISATTRTAVMAAMELDKKKRPQSIKAFLSLLGKPNYAGSPTSDDTVFDTPTRNTANQSSSEPIIEVVSVETGFWATFKRDWRNRPLITNLVLMLLFISSLGILVAPYEYGYNFLWPLSVSLYPILGTYLIIRNRGEYFFVFLFGVLWFGWRIATFSEDVFLGWVGLLLPMFVVIASMLIKKNNKTAWKYLMQNNGQKNNFYVQLKKVFIIVFIPIIYYLFALHEWIGPYTAESIICILCGFTIHYVILICKDGNKSKLLYWIPLVLSFCTAYCDYWGL